jgi:predicted double-glycine peptidase
MTEYSCGASALQAVLKYWGKHFEEEALMKLMGTNDEVGTYPEDMLRGIRALGLDAELRENTTLDELEAFTSAGHPVIVLAQVWRSQKDTPAAAADEWDCGHYIVVLAVDKNYVYFQDPYIRMGKGFVPRSTFLEHWHQIMGGAKVAMSSKLHQVAIFVRGEQPTERSDPAETTPATLDLGNMGSVTVISIHFPKYLMPFDFLSELKGMFEQDVVRPDAFVLLRKDSEGKVSALQGGRLEQESDIAEVNALIAALTTQDIAEPELVRANARSAIRAAARGDFGVSASQLRRRAERLSPDSSEIIVLFENLWERRLRALAHHYQGALAEHWYIPTATLGRLGQGLSDTKV